MSGGVDSVVLLNVLSMHDDLELIVAHFDHGIRPESDQDATFVKELASSYGLPFELGHQQLGEHTSEALARSCRYKFLHDVRLDHGAKAILTAHHEDDVIETAWINIIRGTKYRGIYALRSRETVIRPLCHVSKKQILEYAKNHKLKWREDATNQLDIYLRNRIRKQKEAHLTDADRAAVTASIKSVEKSGKEIEQLAGEVLAQIADGNNMERLQFTLFPYAVSCEILATFLRNNEVVFDTSTIERAVVDIKTKPAGKLIVLPGATKLLVSKEHIRLHDVSSV